MVTLEKDLKRLVENELETEVLVARLQERNAKLERVAEAARQYLATMHALDAARLRAALEDLDE